MARDYTIAISARDNITDAITTMRNANQGFNKDLEGTNRRLNELTKAQSNVKSELKQMQKTMQEAAKQFALTGDAADKAALQMAFEELENGQRNLRLISKNAREAEKDILSMTNAVGRMENRAGGSDLLSSLAKAGLGKMAGDSLASAANVMVGSAFGESFGSAISGTLSGAVTGAAMGQMLGLPGAAIGAGIGAAAGIIEAGAGYFQKQDEFFSSEVQTRLQEADTGMAGSLERGQELSQQWATGLMAFESLLPGRSEAFMEDLRRMDADNPFDMAGLMSQSKLLMTSGVDEETTKRALGGIGNAAAITGMSNQDMEQIAQTIGYMGNLSSISKRQTDIFTMRGVPIMEYLAAARGISVAEAYDAMSKGKISGAEAQQVAIDGMAGDPQYAGAAQALMNTVAGAQSALDSQYETIERGMGEGYDEIALGAKKEQLNRLEDGLTDALTEAHTMAGRGMAEREMLGEQYKLDAENAVFGDGTISDLYSGNAEDAARLKALREEYAQAKKDDDNMAAEFILKEVTTLYETAFQDSPEMTAMRDSQKELVESTQEILASHEGYVSQTLDLQRQMQQGIASVANLSLSREGGIRWELKAESAPSLNSLFGSINQQRDALGITGNDPNALGSGRSITPPSGNAWGVPYVPHDNYITRLHEGERVLTAQEARAQRQESPTININVSGLVVREEADIHRIACELAAELQRAQQVS